MAMKHGGRGPGHLSRWTAATSPIPYLFAFGSQGAWFDFTDTSTWYQDAAGTTPAATLGDVVGLVLDKSRGLALGPELLGSGAVGLVGAATAATYNTGTGAGACTRVDASNQSFVQWSGLSGSYLVTVACLTGTAVSVRAGSHSGSAAATVLIGQSTTVLVVSSGGLVTVTSSSGTATFTVSAFKLLAGNHASQATTVQKPLRARIPLGGRRNIWTYSEDFGQTVWTKARCSVSTDVIAAPDGTSTADKLVEDATTNSHPIYRTYTGFNNATAYTQMIFVKAAGRDKMRIELSGAAWAGNPAGSFDLVALTATPLNTATGATITDFGNGWRLCTVSGVATATGSGEHYISPLNAAGVASYTGDGTSGLYIWGAQLELGSSATAYQKVVADWDVTESGVTSIPALYYDGSDDSLATAAIDFATCTSDGAARRNLLTFPSVFNDAAWLKSNASVAATGYPDYTGGSNARKLVESASNATHFTYQAATLVAGSATISVYAKAAERTSIEVYFSGTYFTGSGRFNLSAGTCTSVGAGTATITDAGGGWYRCSVTTTGSTGESAQFRIFLVDANNYIGDGTSGVYIYRAQMEAGSTATAFQDIGTDKMTVFAGVEKLSDAAQGIFCELSTDTGSNNGSFRCTFPGGAGAATYGWVSKGTSQAALVTTGEFPAPSTAVYTAQGSIAADSAILRVNGAEKATSASDQGTGNYGNYALYLGRRASASLPFKGYMIGHLVIVGKLANASEIAAVEAFERAATGAY